MLGSCWRPLTHSRMLAAFQSRFNPRASGDSASSEIQLAPRYITFSDARDFLFHDLFLLKTSDAPNCSPGPVSWTEMIPQARQDLSEIALSTIPPVRHDCSRNGEVTCVKEQERTDRLMKLAWVRLERQSFIDHGLCLSFHRKISNEWTSKASTQIIVPIWDRSSHLSLSFTLSFFSSRNIVADGPNRSLTTR